MVNVNSSIVQQDISTDEFEYKDVHIAVRRLDQMHPEVNGNKWFKLKYNLERCLATEHKTLLTFGGAWSNHIAATAAAGDALGIRTIGIIRGEEPPRWSETLLKAKGHGMELGFITREAYSMKHTEDMKAYLHEQYGSFHLVPEGGSNFLGINGCMEILQEADKNADVIFCACGTGATAAGLLLSAAEHQRIIGIPVFKDGNFLRQEIINHIKYFLMDDDLANEYNDRLEVFADYHFGGYGKWNDELLRFMEDIKSQYGLPLDQVYTGKMMFALFDLIDKGVIQAKTNVLVIHSGGLQGLAGLKRATAK